MLLSEADGNLYTGYTKDLKLRFEQHNKGLVLSTVDPPRQYWIISRGCLKQLLDADEKTLTDSYKHWVEDYIQEGTKQENVWTETIAAGSVEFVEGIYPVKLT